MKKTLLLLACTLGGGLAHSAPELKGNPEELRQFLHPTEHMVTLTGRHDQTAWSDKALVSLVITTKADKLADSISSNAGLRTRITRTMLDAGIDGEEIKTAKFSSSPQFGWFGSKPKSFEVVNRMTIGISDETHLQLLAGLADTNDEIVMSEMQFEHTAKDEFEKNVKRAALDDALSQKADYEAALGVTLLPVSFNEQALLQDGFVAHYDAIEEIVVTANSRSSLRSAAPSAPMPPQTFEKIKYASTIYVTFKVMQGGD